MKIAVIRRSRKERTFFICFRIIDSHTLTGLNYQVMLSWPSNQSVSLISRNEPRLWSPRVTDDGRAHPFKINLQAEQQVCETVRKSFMFTDNVAVLPQVIWCHCSRNSVLAPFFSLQEYKPIGTGHNRRAQPFVAAANIDDKRQVVSTSYNTPIGLYSSGNIQDAMEGQIRGFVQPKSGRWALQLIIAILQKSFYMHIL